MKEGGQLLFSLVLIFFAFACVWCFCKN
uniref:Uncharacterized protein n=1 Tax=Rhizophora mucronata TaxID=61149 RepID=A0A2P2NDY8_RHIMU